LVRAAARIHGHVTGNVCTFAQRGALAALGAAEEPERLAAFEARRDLLHGLVSPLLPGPKPAGGLFLWLDARGRLGGRFPDTAALAAHLLQAGRVAVLPGSACGAEGWLRLSFSGTEAALREGAARLRGAL
ncbi:MAG: aminotransferase class I/II-fold pyridoxal phosphate-dependent enzyme, partial [Elusimicrobia bacterium]|nr:aminotransferase class I/II-fold pyridoxal phosphate-dependent enzyme [Elusimicrobiota bacterium]